MFAVLDEDGKCGELIDTQVETKERLVVILNKALDVLCEWHNRNIKDVQEIVSKALKQFVEMRDSLIGETENKYAKLCEEVLEMEERENEGNELGQPNELKIMVEPIFPMIGEDVLEFLLHNTFIVVQPSACGPSVKSFI